MNGRIDLEVPTRSDAEALQQALSGFDSDLIRADDAWLVALRPNRETAPELLNLFDAIGNWLEERREASLRARFGERSFTIMRPSQARPTDSAEFLLERVIQLENALESRIAIEQAKGVLAGQLKVGVDEAFDVLRGAARRAGHRLRDLADEVVASAEVPEVIRDFVERRTNDGRPAPSPSDPEPSQSG